MAYTCFVPQVSGTPLSMLAQGRKHGTTFQRERCRTSLAASFPLPSTSMCSGSFFWRCVDCGRDFVFFAREQQHWFETLKPAGIAWAALLRQTDKQHPAHEHP
ncbi:hypothetical protein Spb1_33020 [Planctopirus ephydatiae]|uniref:Probable zinc-binding domain-containing protein n=2 Tax=Planctopirus ephydatiae TaxID=2528019 RepID=A0A518GRY8_9PLAN|nr:hypothetical protein Spb1_33020 [Planctopirus ephydatiae]